jgi:7-carboxy-7-deazaguanine synthase (Cx14CxxC type)
MYSVKEIYFTLQGEGAQTGRAAVFLRFAGCNLWTGREADRASAVCQFCDTDFVGTDGPGGGKFADARALAEAVAAHWPDGGRPLKRDPKSGNRFSDKSRADSKEIEPYSGSPRTGSALVVCTGGEPLLQIDAPLIDALHEAGFEIAIETNGTIAAPDGIDWICVSPKAGAPLVQRSGQELKLVYPQEAAPPEAFELLDFQHFFLQPMDGPQREANTAAAARYCLEHPRWRLSLQTHKFIGLA